LRIGRVVTATILAVAVAVLTSSIIATMAIEAIRTPFVDWQTYALAWQRATQGQSIYAPAQVAGSYALKSVVLIGYAYPPATVFLFGPFSSFPAGLVAWITVDLGILLTGVWALITRTWPDRRFLVFAIVLLVLAQFDPLKWGVATGNVSIAIAGGFMWAWLAGPRLAGVAGALAGFLKIAPGTLVAFALRSGWRAVVPGLAVVAVLVLASLPILGVGSWGDYVTAMINAVPTCDSGFASVPSVACRLPDPTIGRWITIGIAGLLALAAWWIRWRYVAFVCVVAGSLVGAADLHLHDLTVAFVAVLVGVTEAATARRSKAVEDQLRS
jgi:hypothetical protein